MTPKLFFLTTPLNPRIIHVGINLQRPSEPTTKSKQGQSRRQFQLPGYIGLVKVISNQVLSISKDGGSLEVPCRSLQLLTYNPSGLGDVTR